MKRAVISFLLGNTTKTRLLILCAVVTIICGPAYAANYALEFDGSDDIAIIPNSNDYNFGQDDFTIDLWIKFNSFSHSRFSYILSNYNNMNQGFEIYYDAYISQLIYYADDYVTVNWAPVTGQWYHIAYSISGPSTKFFLDGAQIDVDKASTNVTDSINSLQIGAYYNGALYYDFYLDGSIDELRIWDYARTPEDINYWKNYSLSGNEQGLVSYWDFNEGSGSILHDKSGNGHDGVLGTTNIDGGSVPVWTASEAPVTPVPEPATMLLFGLGGACLAVLRRRKIWHQKSLELGSVS